MADFIDPATGEIFLSVHTPDGEAQGWVKNPSGLAEAKNIPAIYRIIDGDRVREANAKERQAIDAKRLPQIKAAKREEVVSLLLGGWKKKSTDDYRRLRKLVRCRAGG